MCLPLSVSCLCFCFPKVPGSFPMTNQINSTLTVLLKTNLVYLTSAGICGKLCFNCQCLGRCSRQCLFAQFQFRRSLVFSPTTMFLTTWPWFPCYRNNIPFLGTRAGTPPVSVSIWLDLYNTNLGVVGRPFSSHNVKK